MEDSYQLYTERSVGENFSQSFSVVKRQLALMVKSVMTVAGPFIAFGLIIELINLEYAAGQTKMLIQFLQMGDFTLSGLESLGALQAGQSDIHPMMSLLGLLGQIAIFMGSTFTYAAVYATVRITSDPDYDGTFESIVEYTNTIKWRLLGFYLLFFLALSIGFAIVVGLSSVLIGIILGAVGVFLMLLIGFCLMCFLLIRYAFILPVVAYESVDFVQMMKRSWALSGPTFGYVLTHVLIIFGVALVSGVLAIGLLASAPDMFIALLDNIALYSVVHVVTYALGLFFSMYMCTVSASMYGSVIVTQGQIEQEDEWLDD